MKSSIVIDIQEERKIESEAQALVELHDFIKSHPDAPVKEIARFMPPVDSRAVNKAIQFIALRNKKYVFCMNDNVCDHKKGQRM